ncbi:GtrA family protein [Cellulomonas sp. NPDC058312]|uniref:GtrA family protein n=1 Tax=Cellulomonas sp. NPDC058312 TaxID=3346441 RepID=UPI0036E3FC2F
MNSGIGAFIRRALGNEQIRYLLVAGTTTLGYLGLLALLLSTGMPYMYAILLAQAVTIGVAFPTYRRLIFRSTNPWRRDLPRFVGVWGSGFVAGVVATPALVELAGIPPLPAQVVAVVAVAVLSYLGHRFVSFGAAR